jgi:hypothetical protein
MGVDYFSILYTTFVGERYAIDVVVSRKGSLLASNRQHGCARTDHEMVCRHAYSHDLSRPGRFSLAPAIYPSTC